MAWYKLTATHGPGHQGSTHKFRYWQRPLTKDEKEDWWSS